MNWKEGAVNMIKTIERIEFSKQLIVKQKYDDIKASFKN